jgi:N-acetylglutamate synthase
MTDVLGICQVWADGVCVVRPESGPPVQIPWADIVAGKPVPPRASVRDRVSARSAERHALPLWPAVERLPLGEWELRSDPAPVGRPLKRANSCLALGDPGTSLQAAADAVRDFYDSRGRPPLAQVETGSAADLELTRLGWTLVPGGDSRFLVASVAQARRRAGRDDDAGLEEDLPRVLARRSREGVEVGTARAALDEDWLGVHGLYVVPGHRGEGHATALMAALLGWGAELGATTVWLHVETDNAGALDLYERLGFREHHSCRYLAAPS